MESETTYLSKSEFAASQGWSPSYVTKLKDQARLVLSADGKKVNLQATLALLQKTTDPGKESVRMHHAAERTEKHVGVHARHDAPSEDVPGGTASANPKYWEAKANREDNLAQLAQLELAKKRGDLVDRQRVETVAFASGRMLRDAMLGLPTQLAPELATMTDAFQIEVKMREALRKVLADHAQMTADDLLKAMEPPH
jgi:hypothetical protein